MPEAQSKFLKKIIGEEQPELEEESGRPTERQLNAFSLNFRFKDGRRTGGISWGQYVNHEWEDNGEWERLSILMGMQVVRIEGLNLTVLIPDIESGQLRRVKERNSQEVEALRRNNPDNVAIVRGIEIVPSHREMARRLMEEDEHEVGFAKRARG